MGKKQIQYINLIKSGNNIKIINRIFEKNKLISSSSSIFLLKNGLLSNEAYFKLKALTNNTNSFISTIFENTDQQIVPVEEVISDEFKTINLDFKQKLVVKKYDIDEYLAQFDVGIDYLFSPYSILFYKYLSNPINNSLNLLILNNTIYTFIVKENNKIVKTKIATITNFEEIKKSKFYNDEIEEQKLYDEVYYFELLNFLKEFIEEYYNDGGSFIEKINIFYDIKQLDKEKIASIKEELLIETSYEKIEIDEILFELSFNKGLSTQNLHKISKKNKSNLFYLIIIFLITSIIAGYFIYQTVKKDDLKETKKTKKEVKKEKITKKAPKKITQILLPNHVEHNNFIKNLIYKIFDSVIDEVILKKLQISKNETTFVFTYKNLKDLYKFNDKLGLIFEKNEILLTSKSKNKYNSIITSTNFKIKEQKTTSTYKFSKISINEIKNLISKNFKKYNINKIATFNKKYTTIVYNVKVISKSTRPFFNFLDNLNKQVNNIQINFPITFEKANDGLEIGFKLYILYKKE